ncbi:enoyl-CoA hydratase/isomerase family protein [Halovenus sp. WSH3]|uniref:Enoyl-CoA hydratase/isomerase family protein n=2 Tax=Halovenus carboxidivorans TaxID=2692199 RepID=A0A6B0T2Z4_9EURY|nr:enoyl-CoA hydratase/isomerase family protein [Halovenus carboxidivorans]
MDNGLARIDRDGYRGEVVIQRPEKRNAMNEDLLRDLLQAFRTLDEDDEIRAVILRGEGPVLSAGMDLEMMRGLAGESTDESVTDSLFPDVLAAIEDCSVPTIAAIHGAAPAGAFELTLPFDFRIIDSEANYGVVEVKLGTFPHGGATQRLPRLVGLAKAKEIVLTGEYVDPAEAAEAGLVREVVDPGEVVDTARELAEDLAANGPIGMRMAKRALNAAAEMPLEEGLAFERALAKETYRTDDYREGVEARLEGREPEFRNE